MWCGIIISCALVTIGIHHFWENWGKRRSARPIDYKVLEAIFTNTHPERFVLKNLVVEFYQPFLIPSPDVYPLEYSAVYELEVGDNYLYRMLQNCQEHPIAESVSAVEAIEKYFEVDEIHRYFTRKTGPVENQIVVCGMKPNLRLFVHTYGVDYPHFWQSIIDDMKLSLSWGTDRTTIEECVPMLWRGETIFTPNEQGHPRSIAQYISGGMPPVHVAPPFWKACSASCMDFR